MEIIGAEAFRGCRALSKVTLPESLVKIGDRAFKGCRKLVGIAIPQGVQTLGEEAVPKPKRSTAEWSPEERKEHLDRIVGKREKILAAIQNDQAIPVSSFSEKLQKMAAECGLTPNDTISYKHTESYVMHCPCAMQFPALTRVAVRVPRSRLYENESECVVAFLDEDRDKDWIVLSLGEVGAGVEVYASIAETKHTRFAKIFALLSVARRERK